MEEKRNKVELSGFISEETNMMLRLPRVRSGRSAEPAPQHAGGKDGEGPPNRSRLMRLLCS